MEDIILEIGYIKIYKPILIDEGEGYFMRATRIDVGSFNIIAIEQMHPNYGYFTEYMLWIKSFHIRKWKSIPVIRASYNMSLERFLELYPQFKSIFE